MHLYRCPRFRLALLFTITLLLFGCTTTRDYTWPPPRAEANGKQTWRDTEASGDDLLLERPQSIEEIASHRAALIRRLQELSSTAVGSGAATTRIQRFSEAVREADLKLGGATRFLAILHGQLGDPSSQQSIYTGSTEALQVKAVRQALAEGIALEHIFHALYSIDLAETAAVRLLKSASGVDARIVVSAACASGAKFTNFGTIARELGLSNVETREIHRSHPYCDGGIERIEVTGLSTRRLQQQSMLAEYLPGVHRFLFRPQENYAVVRLVFATDREAAPGNSVEPFSNVRGSLQTGFAYVSIPHQHKLGEIEGPSILRLEFSEDPRLHITLVKSELVSANKLFAQLRSQLDQKSGGKPFLLFVHGYNNTFSDAAKRAAQIAYDLRFTGHAGFYSWPSHGGAADYVGDEANIEWSQPNIELFLENLMQEFPESDFYLIAHSMGSRGMSRALVSLFSKNPSYRQRVKEVVLAAPDIDAAVFRRDIAPNIQSPGSGFTMYVSSKDRALLLSRKIHKNYRAGELQAGPVVSRGLETVDASIVDTDFLGHTYFAKTRTLLSDLQQLLSTRKRANSRAGLAEQTAEHGPYWVIRP